MFTHCAMCQARAPSLDPQETLEHFSAPPPPPPHTHKWSRGRSNILTRAFSSDSTTEYCALCTGHAIPPSGKIPLLCWSQPFPLPFTFSNCNDNEVFASVVNCLLSLLISTNASAGHLVQAFFLGKKILKWNNYARFLEGSILRINLWERTVSMRWRLDVC